MSLPDPEILDRLDALGAASDEDFDLAETALALSLCERPDLALDDYRATLHAMAHEADRRRKAGAALSDALSETIAEEWGLRGDVESYDDLRNADVAWTLDRRCGLPVTLGVIYLIAARRHGWTAAGLAFPGHFVIGLHDDDGAAIIDPFRGGARRSGDELEALLRAVEGGPSRLGPEVLKPVSDRLVLDRMLANLESRSVEPTAAASVAARRRRIRPKEVPLVLHAAQAAIQVGWHGEAQDAFSRAMGAAADDPGLLRKAAAGRDDAARKLN